MIGESTQIISQEEKLHFPNAIGLLVTK